MFARELLAIHLAVPRLLNTLGSSPRNVFTDHKPLAHSASDCCWPREIQHLYSISQFAVHVRRVTEGENSIVDALFSVHQLSPSLTSSIDLDAMAQARVIDPDFDQIWKDSSLHLAALPVTTSQHTFFCDLPQDVPRSVVRTAHGYPTFLVLNNVAHPPRPL